MNNRLPYDKNLPLFLLICTITFACVPIIWVINNNESNVKAEAEAEAEVENTFTELEIDEHFIIDDQLPYIDVIDSVYTVRKTAFPPGSTAIYLGSGWFEVKYKNNHYLQGCFGTVATIPLNPNHGEISYE